MVAGRLRLSVEQGANLGYQFRVVKADGSPLDLTGWMPRIQAREDADSETELIDYTEDGLHLQNLLTLGFFNFVMDAGETKLLDWDTAQYNIELVKATGVVVGFGGGFTQVAFSNAGGNGVMTANGGTPFAGVAAGDLVRLTLCEDSGNNGSYKILTASDTVLTMTRGFTTANAADTAVVIAFQALNEAVVIRLLEKAMPLSKEIAR